MKNFRIILSLILMYVLWMLAMELLGMLSKDHTWFYVLGLPFLLSPGFLITQLTSLNSSNITHINSAIDSTYVLVHAINIFSLIILGFMLGKLLEIRRKWHENRPY